MGSEICDLSRQAFEADTSDSSRTSFMQQWQVRWPSLHSGNGARMKTEESFVDVMMLDW